MTRPASTEELFKQSGGGAPLYFSKDSQVGDSVEGTVLESSPQQARGYDDGVPKNWDDGSPMMQLVVTLQTNLRDRTIENDDGRRRVFLRWWGSDRQNTIEAVQRAGDSFVKDGAWMRVRFTGFGEQKDRKLNPPKVFAVEYKSPPSATEGLFKNGGPIGGAQSSVGSTYGQTVTVTSPTPAVQPQTQSDAVTGARAVQVDRREQIAKVQKLLAAGFSEREIVDMVPGMSSEAVAAIVGL